MNAREALKATWNSAQFIVDCYLNDLSDADLLVRPVPGSNHIAWQLGHLINSEHQMLSAVKPGVMPALPAGFTEKHAKEAAASDQPKDFLSKAEYLKLAQEQRAAAHKLLDQLTDNDLDLDAPEQLRSWAPKVVDVMAVIGGHWLMHAGQWAVVRRKLGRTPLF